jgi:hypothetical protein
MGSRFNQFERYNVMRSNAEVRPSSCALILLKFFPALSTGQKIDESDLVLM